MPTALIVEDEPEANKLLAMLVQLRGYETASVYDGTSALARVRTGVPDVILLDLMLPDLNGHDVCRALKASCTTALLPVVIVTARLAAENRIESFSAGADDYVPKPYTPDQIYSALDQAAAWKARLAEPTLGGEVFLDGRDDGTTLRQLAQLRSILLAKGLVDSATVDRITSAIRAMWASVDDWSRQRGLSQVARLSYALEPDVLTLTVQDEARWLPGASDLGDQALLHSLTAAQFDHVSADEAAGLLTLVKRLSGP
jgi:CheY-like chemotaxis protein